ncbi:MAG: TIGR03118 family protein [Geodermatophilaceae bacterium]|nr:TIGR03118 family protein [Geodermatophilaceae bacterium]
MSGLVMVLSAAACGSDDSSADPAERTAGNSFDQVNLVASSESYQARFTVPEMVNAWGIAIRPRGAGGHFWITGGGSSHEFVGDVSSSPDPSLQRLFQDQLTTVTIPGTDASTEDSSIGKATGVVFNGADISSDAFRVSEQPVRVDGRDVALGGSARFIFATDSGRIAAWGEQAADGSVVRANGPAQEVFNGEAQGMQFFGLAIKQGSFDRLWAADFGTNPQIRQFDTAWRLMSTEGFANPFATGAPVDPANPAKGSRPQPGDPVPFNITTVGQHVFVAYALSQPAESLGPDGPVFDAGEEDSLDADEEQAVGNRPDKGKLAEFTSTGELVRVFDDQGRLNAPWGVAIAPEGFGALAGKVLVSNFGGAGRISVFDDTTGDYVDDLRDEAGKPVAIEGIWGILFGNGESLGDATALYFAAGPEEEVDGLFGALHLPAELCSAVSLGQLQRGALDGDRDPR